MEKIGFCSFGTWLACSAVLFATTAAVALPGDLDLSFGGFGNEGRIEATQQNARDAAIDALGRLVTAGTVGDAFHVQRRSGSRFLTVENLTVLFPGQQSASANAVAIAPDGKIILAGEVRLNGQEFFGVARLDADLTPDTTFGGGDGLQTSQPNGTGLALRDVAVQSNNKIVIVGDFLNGSSEDDREIVVQRFNDDGSPDLGFDGDGELTLSGDGAIAAAVALSDSATSGIGAGGPIDPPDQQIVIAGAINHQDDFVVIRLNADGTPDTGFSEDGQAIADFGEADESAADLAISSDGKVVVVGTGLETGRVLVARYLSDGTPDSNFGDGNGQVATVISPMGSATSVVIQSDGKIVVGGQLLSNGSPGAFLLIRYYADGSLDDTFGEPSAPGLVVTPFGAATTAVAAVALQVDGMLVAVGGEQAARYRWNGSLDTGGLVTMSFHPQQTRGEVTGLAVDGDGRLVAAGTVRVGDLNMALARFDQEYSNGLDLTFGTDDPSTGRTMYGSDTQNEEVQALAIRADGKPLVAGRLSSTGPTRMMVGRFNEDGTPDLQCDSIGFTSTSFGFGNDEARALALAPNDRTYVAGRVIGPEDFDYGLARFAPACTVDTVGSPPVEYKLALDIDGSDFPNGIVYQAATDRPVLAGITDGGDVLLTRIVADNAGILTPDATFGAGGYATADVGTNENVAGIAAQSDGKLIVAGTVADDFYVIRFSANGEPDDTFGTGGVALADLGGRDGAQGLALRADNSIAVVGSSFSDDTSRTVFGVAQFTRNGVLDPDFGTNGIATVEFGADGSDVAQAITFVGSDRLVVGGFTTAAGIRQFALAALETNIAAPRSCTGDCDGDGAVLVDELLTMINIALGNAGVSVCEAGDADGNEQVTVDEILTAVNNALTGCA